MASEAAHLEKAAANHAFLGTVGDEYPDWLAVVAFYEAVHLVEALFARRGTPSNNHSQRKRRLKVSYPVIWKQFRPLYHASKLVRYTGHKISVQNVREVLIANRLRMVTRLVRHELGLPVDEADVRDANQTAKLQSIE